MSTRWDHTAQFVLSFVPHLARSLVVLVRRPVALVPDDELVEMWRCVSSHPMTRCRILWSLASVVSLVTWIRSQMGGCESRSITLIWQSERVCVFPLARALRGNLVAPALESP